MRPWTPRPAWPSLCPSPRLFSGSANQLGSHIAHGGGQAELKCRCWDIRLRHSAAFGGLDSSVRYLLDAVKVFAYVVLILLPAVQLVRDWRYPDARTRVHHQITRGLLLVFLLSAIASGAFFWTEILESGRLRAKVDELLEGNRRLLKQNQDLATKVDKYQVDLDLKEKQIRELDLKARMAARGVMSTYDFNGARRRTTPLCQYE